MYVLHIFDSNIPRFHVDFRSKKLEARDNELCEILRKKFVKGSRNRDIQIYWFFPLLKYNFSYLILFIFIYKILEI